MNRALAWLCLALAASLAPLPAASAGGLKVAAIFALTGPAAGQNADSVLGIRLAAEELNARGGVLGQPLEVVFIDNKSTPIGSKVAAEEAVRMGVSAILGANWSSHSLAVARVAQDSGIPMITPISTNPAVTKVGDCIFRVCYTDEFQGRVMARLASGELKAGTALTFIDVGDDYSLGLAKAFREDFVALGGRLATQIHYKLKQRDFGADISQAKAAQAEVCFLSGHDESGVIAAGLAAAEVGCIPLGGDGWVGGHFLAMGGEKIARGYYCTHWSPEVDSPASRAFVARYGTDPRIDASVALAYDATMLLAEAATRAGSFERRSVREALAATRGFPGVTGDITFDAGGDPLKGAVIMELVNGRARYYKTVAPN